MTDQEVLRSVFLFRGAPEIPEGLPAAVDYPKSAAINSDNALGIILRGRAEAVTREGTPLTFFRQGDSFGATALFGGTECISQIRAVSDCRVQFIPQEILERWFRSDPQIALNYIAFLSDKVRFLNGKIAIYTQDSAEQRLYRWLCANCGEDGQIPVSMTQLAELLSIGRTSLYRALNTLEEKNLCTRKGRKWEVKR